MLPSTTVSPLSVYSGGGYAYNGNFAALRALPAGTSFTRANAVSTYVDSAGLVQTAGANTPRFTYDPTTLTSLGLMSEESRINILTYSRNMTSAGFGLTNLTEAYGFAGVDGTANAMRLTVNSTTNTTNTKSYVATTTTCSVSCWIKKGNHAYEGAQLFIRNHTSSTTLASGTLNFDTGVFTWNTDPTTSGTYRVVQCVDGWWKVSISYWGAGITIGNTVHVRLAGTGGVLTSGTYLYYDGLQVEESPFPTSYMPTAGAAVTRSADVCSFTWADTAWQAAAFTVLAKYRYNMPTRTGAAQGYVYRMISAVQGSGIILVDTARFNMYSGTPTDLDIYDYDAGPYIDSRAAVKCETNNTRMSTIGRTVKTDLTCTFTSRATVIAIGSTGSSSYLNGTIAELKIPKRGYTDAELQAYA